MLCRDEIGLIEQRTAFVNQLQESLHEYYPAVLEAFDDWTKPAAWAFIERFSIPGALKKAGKRRWEKFLHSHRLSRPGTYQKRLEVFGRATEFCGNQAVTNAKSVLAVSRAKQLHVLEQQLNVYRKRIEELFLEHPDHDLHRVKFRHACNKNFRTAVHLWADLSRKKCSWAQIYYHQKRREGKSHACALRCLGQRWLKILWKIWQTKKPYDEQWHTRNQIRHGSWVLSLTPAINTPDEITVKSP